MISFIICTIGRPELGACIASILSQKGNYEVVVVDQSAEGVTLPGDSRLLRVKCTKEGLSSARNKGFGCSRGEVVAFVDDDAVLCRGYVAAVSRLFTDPWTDAVAGRVLVKGTLRPYARTQKGHGRFLSKEDWTMVMGGNIAFRRRTIEETGPFDRSFGTGARWGCAEETDYFLRMCYSGKRIFYSPELAVFHPLEAAGHTDESLNAKLFEYGKGHGALFAKHLILYGQKKAIFQFLFGLAKPFIRILQYLLMLKIRLIKRHFWILSGKWRGFWGFIHSEREASGHA